jgi:hypothetical protein
MKEPNTTAILVKLEPFLVAVIAICEIIQLFK